MTRRCLFALVLIALILAMTILPVVVLADAGDFSGGSDWGSSGGWSGSDWDSGGSDWGSDSGSFAGGLVLGSLGGAGGGGIIGLVIVVLVLVFIVRSIKLSQARRGGAPVNVPTAPRSADISALLAADPAFSQQAFLENVSNLYVRLQNAWQNKNLEPVRPLLSGALYAQFERQLQRYITSKETNYVEHIAVLSTDIVDYRQDQVNDILTVLVRTRITDYVRSDVTGKILRGSETGELFMTYEWTLIRTKGSKTESGAGIERDTCPSCGAPIDLNQSAKCAYCGSVITAADYGWVLNEIRGISQQSGN